MGMDAHVWVWQIYYDNTGEMVVSDITEAITWKNVDGLSDGTLAMRREFITDHRLNAVY